MKLIARGRHSFIFLTQDGNIIKKFKSGLQKNFEKEVYFLTKLRYYDFVPRLISYDEKNLEVKMEYVQGIFLLDLIKSNRLLELSYTIKKSIDICYLLDRLYIQKGEMHRPYKHIILSGYRVVFIDWERAKETKKPSNLTQFVQFLVRDRKLKSLLQINSEFARNICREYKKSFSKELVELLKSKIDKILDGYSA